MKPSTSKLALTAIALFVAAAASTATAADRRTTRVYVTNSKGDEVTVIDAATMKVIGSIQVGANPHGLVLSPDRRTLYISVERSEEHTSELQSQSNLVCRLLLEKKKTTTLYTLFTRYAYD